MPTESMAEVLVVRLSPFKTRSRNTCDSSLAKRCHEEFLAKSNRYLLMLWKKCHVVVNFTRLLLTRPINLRRSHDGFQPAVELMPDMTVSA